MDPQSPPSPTFPRLRWALLIALSLGLTLLVAACNRNQPQVQPGIDFTLQRLTPEVLLGADASSLQKLTSDAPEPVPAGYVVSTDAAGEGLLRGQLPSNETCAIHIFFDTSLQAAACSKAEQQTGSTVTCQQQGTAVYQGCVANLQQTPSGVIQIVGSWVVVSYQPEKQLTLVTVLDGRAQVQPVIDAAAYTLGESVTLEKGYFLFTTPGDSPPDIAGLKPRHPLPLSKLPTILDNTGLGPWYERVREKAIEDEILPSYTPVIQGAGGPLENADVGQAVLMSIDWSDILVRIALAAEPAAVSLPGIHGRTTADFPYSPSRAQALLERAEIAGPIGFYVVMEDGAYTRVAARLEDYLAKLDIFIGIIPIDPEHAPAVIEEKLGEGAGVIWIGPQLDLDIEALAAKVAPPSRPPSPTLQGGGGPLEDPFVVRAVLTAIDWRALQSLFGTDAPIPLAFPGIGNASSDDFPHDLPYARQILGESGAEGGFPIFLVILNDETYLQAADLMRDMLAELGLKTVLFPTNIETAPDRLAELKAKDQAVLWLGPEISQDWRETAPAAQTLILTPEAGESGVLTSAEEVYPGQWAAGDTKQDAGVQMILSFDISGIPPEARITDASLNLTPTKISGYPFGKLGCLRAYASKAKTFGVEAFAWKPELGALARWCSEDELRSGGLQQGLPETLQAALGGKRYRLRLQFNERLTNDDGVADLIRFDEPALRITFTLP